MNVNYNSKYVMSEGELNNICSALRALKITGTQHIPINIEFDTLILRQHLNACVDKLRVAMFKFYLDHRSSVDDFARNENNWSFKYHYMSGYVSAYQVKDHFLSEEFVDGCVDNTTHISFTMRYNIKDMYMNSPLDSAVLDEFIELYTDIKTIFADFE
jgi:hypothetical protein